MRFLVTGANGQLATDLIKLCIEGGDEAVGLSRTQLDITDQDAVHSAITSTSPDVVVNCAAWTGVDACEDDPGRAHQVNGVAVGILGQIAQEHGSHLVQISTDYVFDGDKTGPYLETDATNPQSVYGQSKLAGEMAAHQVSGAVIRTSWLCSAHGGNMVSTILRLANEHPIMRFVSDQRGHPTFTSDLSAAVRQIGSDRLTGTLPVTNSGPLSWFEFAQAVLHAAGEDPGRIEPILTRDLLPARPAKRPANSVLSNSVYEDLGYQPLRDFREPLAEAIDTYI